MHNYIYILYLKYDLINPVQYCFSEFSKKKGKKSGEGGDSDDDEDLDDDLSDEEPDFDEDDFGGAFDEEEDDEEDEDDDMQDDKVDFDEEDVEFSDDGKIYSSSSLHGTTVKYIQLSSDGF